MIRPRTGTARLVQALLLCALVPIALLGAQAPPRAEIPEEQIPEYVVKAGFLFNLAKYVAWPEPAFETANAPILIGIVGDDPFGDVLERTLAGKSVHDHPFQIRRFRELADIRNVHMLFVPRSESGRLTQILRLVDDQPVLTVGEQAAFAVHGGMVAILIEGQKPSLHINPSAVERQRLEVDTKLLRIATIVKPAP